MKILPLLLLAALLSGCASFSLPPGACESGNVTFQVGPFWRQDATLSGVVKKPDGTFGVTDFVGSTSYLGVLNFTQHFHDLVLLPKTAPAAVPAMIAAPAK